MQRWEREEGLPVQRLAHEKRGSVYALRHEVDAWWESRRVSLADDAPDDVAEPGAPGRPERITWKSAATFWPALSSDGRLLAYISDGGRDGTSPQIWLQQIGGSATCLTSDDRERSHLSFSADDTRLVFTASDATVQGVYSMPTLGGEPRLLKRAATAGRVSPDGKWMAYVALDQPCGVRVASMETTAERALAPSLVDIGWVIWSPAGKHVLVQSRSDPSDEPDYWIVPVDGAEPVNTGISQRLRRLGRFPITLPAAWTGDSLVFSVITFEGVRLCRQRLARETLAPVGDAELLTQGSELDSFPTASAGRVAFVSTHMDQNVWSIAIDPASGMPRAAMRRLTRGAGYSAHLSITRDAGTLCYFLARPTGSRPVLRDLRTDSETTLSWADEHGFPAISPSGTLIATGERVAGPRAARPIYVGSIADGTSRKLGDDCGGRPRQWLDERLLLIERFAPRLNSIAVFDTVSGEQAELLSSAEHSISNARVSADGRWIAFDATSRGINRSLASGLTSGPGGRPSVFIAPMRTGKAIPEADWLVVDRCASHPFWSADGSLLYYLPTTPSTEFRNLIRGRRFNQALGEPFGSAFTVVPLTEMIVPAAMAGTAPIATPDQIVMVLGDFRGDVWIMDVG